MKKDKYNDNLLFSCCCARVDWTWTTVCDCYGGGWKCDVDCLERALIDDSLFYSVAVVSILKVISKSQLIFLIYTSELVQQS